MLARGVEAVCRRRGGQVEKPHAWRPRVVHPGWDDRAAIPKLRAGSYFPWFLEHPAPVGEGAGLGRRDVVPAARVGPRQVEKLAASLGVTGLSKPQVSAMAAELGELVEGFRSRPLDARPRASSAPCGSSAGTFTGPGSRAGVRTRRSGLIPGPCSSCCKTNDSRHDHSRGPTGAAPPGERRERCCKADLSINPASAVSSTVPDAARLMSMPFSCQFIAPAPPNRLTARERRFG